MGTWVGQHRGGRQGAMMTRLISAVLLSTERLAAAQVFFIVSHKNCESFFTAAKSCRKSRRKKEILLVM